MNLREFTEAVDRETKEMSREELWLLVHSLVRKMPDEAREEFLDLIVHGLYAVYQNTPFR